MGKKVLFNFLIFNSVTVLHELIIHYPLINTFAFLLDFLFTKSGWIAIVIFTNFDLVNFQIHLELATNLVLTE